MKYLITLVAILTSFSFSYGQMYKPYQMAAEVTGEMNQIKQSVVETLTNSNFTIQGQYEPANDPNRWVIIITHPELTKAVSTGKGNRAFASTLRIGLTTEDDLVQISYTHPMYWGNAYFQSDFPSVQSNYTKVNNDLTELMGVFNSSTSYSFGSKKGLTAADLRKYHYMMGMPYFEDVVDLAAFPSQNQAIATIESKLKSNTGGNKLVYKVDVPSCNAVLYGIELGGSTGEEKFLPIIDISSPKHTAFLPYEILVRNGKVIMLHGRYRIALSFPDLTMGTFSKIMSTPGDIEDSLLLLME